MIRSALGFVLAICSAYVVASVFHTQAVLWKLQGAGADIPMNDRIAMTLHDIGGMVPLFPIILGGAFVVAFAVAYIVRRITKAPRWLAYGSAGGAAMAVMLVAMSEAFGGTTPIAGARGPVGFGFQVVAGIIGGLVFTAIAPSRD